MPGRIRVQVLAADPVSEAGVASQLRYRSELEVVAAGGSDAQPDVVVVVADAVPYSLPDMEAHPAPGGIVPGGYYAPGVMETVSQGVRSAQAGPDLEVTCEESMSGRRPLPMRSAGSRSCGMDRTSRRSPPSIVAGRFSCSP